jgi:hypothetical protein
MTLYLSENSPKIQQLKDVNIQFKEHQLTSIYAMNELEKTGKIERTINSIIHNFKVYTKPYFRYNQSSQDFKDIKYIIDTNYGILSDIVGSGKTYMIMGLINYNQVPLDRDKIISTSTFCSLKYVDSDKALKTNLIIVPHNLIIQWKEVFKLCPKLKTYIIAKRSHINFLTYAENISDDSINVKNDDDLSDDDKSEISNISPLNSIGFYDVVICSSTMIDEYIDKFKYVKYSRLIIDEICSVKLPINLNLLANFIWFITATPSGIHYIRRYYIKEIVGYGNLDPLIFNNIIIKNDDEYVNKSMQLPNINQILIKCLTPKQLEIVREYVPNDVLDMLNAGNTSEAISRLNCNVDTDDNILQAVTKKIAKELHNKKVELNFQVSLIVIDKKAHEEVINKIKEKISSLETKYESISKRIKEFNNENCPICLEDFNGTDVSILACCSQLFCFKCLLQVKGKCPTCRTPFLIKDINVIKNTDTVTVKKDSKPKTDITKIDALIKIIKGKPNGKFLLFSDYNQTFENLNNKLIEEKITYSKVVGSNAVTNKIIERFTNGETRVLMLNASNYGSGLNLQMATDIIIYHQLSMELETQVIGRAQRIGRKEPLNVYYLLHEHEQNNVTNPILSLDLTSENDIDKFNECFRSEEQSLKKESLNKKNSKMKKKLIINIDKDIKDLDNIYIEINDKSIII